MTQQRIVGFALCVVTVVIYLQGIGDFYLFDSKPNLLNNAALHSDFTRASDWLLAIGSSESGPTGRPLAMLSFALESYLSGGPNATWSKLGNLFLHLVAGSVLYFLTLRVAEQIDGAVSESAQKAMAGTTVAIWLLHPLQVSTVLYSVQRMQILSTLFILLGLLAYCHRRKEWLTRIPSSGEISNCALQVSLCLLLALLSKENGILLLPLILLLEVCLFSCVVAGRERAGWRSLCYLLLLIPLVLFVWQLAFPASQLVEAYSTRPFDLAQRVLTEARILWEYVLWMVLPDIRVLALHHDDIRLSRGLFNPVSTSWAVLAWISTLLVFVYALRRRWRLPALALGWFVVCHSLESTLLPLELVYEHRNYLALASVAWAVSWLIWCVWSPTVISQRLFVGGLLLILLCLQLFSRVTLWKDEEQLASYHLLNHPQSVRATYHYANTQIRLAEQVTEQGEDNSELVGERLSRARHYYQRMSELAPNDFGALVTLLYLDERYFSSHQSEQWMEALLAASSNKELVQIVDAHAVALLVNCQLAAVCSLEHDRIEALFKVLIERQPDNPLYPDLYAVYLGQGLGRLAAAIEIHRQLIDRFPEYLPAFVGLATWLERRGDHGQAYEVLRALLGQGDDISRILTLLTSFREAKQQ